MARSAIRGNLRALQPRPARPAQPGDDANGQTVTAQLTLSDRSLGRLLSMSGRQSAFILSSVDGSVTLRVALEISAVPGAQVVLGQSGVVVDWSQSTLSRGGRRVRLSRMELRLVAALLESSPVVATYTSLTNRLWPGERREKAEGSLSVLVCAVRGRFRTLGVTGAIATVRRQGYRLTLRDVPSQP